MTTPLISLVIGTARESYPLLALPDVHMMQDTFHSLEAQTFRDFELIVMDAVADFRNLTEEINALGAWTFKWKVLRPQSKWHDRHLWSLQASFNQGAVASIGQHIMFCGDCCSFEPDFLERASKYLRQGLAPHAMCAYRKNRYLVDENRNPTEYATVKDIMLAGKYTPLHFLADSRLQFVHYRDVVMPKDCAWTWYFGYGFIDRNDFFAVNGWDENFDGDKALGDVELGSRLQMAGRLKMVLDKNLYVYEELHGPCSDRVLHYASAIRSNFDLIHLMRKLCYWKANSNLYSESDCWRVIRAEITNIPGWPRPEKREYSPVYDHQKFWVENQSVLTLVDQTK